MITEPGRPLRAALAWTALALAGLVLAFLASFAVATTLLSAGVDLAGTLRFDLALFLALLGALGIAGVFAGARLAYGGWPVVAVAPFVLPTLGIAIAMGEELALHAWAEASIGFYDSDFVGWTAGLSFALVGMAVARFGWEIAPPSAEWSPRLWTRIGAALVLFAVLSNAPGALDGIGPDSGPIAVMVVACGLYTVVGLVPPGWRRR
jgi:hypothetical protein